MTCSPLDEEGFCTLGEYSPLPHPGDPTVFMQFPYGGPKQIFCAPL